MIIFMWFLLFRRLFGQEALEVRIGFHAVFAHVQAADFLGAADAQAH